MLNIAFLLSAFIKADILAVKQLNNGFNATSTYETDEKWLNALFLDYLGNEYAITDSLMLIVEAIADLCPEQHGMAVFKARALYVQHKNTFKPAWENCQGLVANRDQEEIGGDFSLERIQVFPNPANGAVTVVLPTRPVENIDYILVNIYGQVVTSGHLQGETTIRTDNLASGLYLLQAKGFGAVKFFIQH